MSQEVKRDPHRIDARRTGEDKNVFARLSAIYAASRKQAQHMLQDSGGISIVEWRTLWDLHEAGPMTISDLAAIQRTDHSLLSRALPQMRRKGFVAMRQATDDRRQTIVSLTEEGRQAYSRAAPVMASRRRALRETFSDDEITAFISILERFEQFAHQPAATFASKGPAE